MTTYTIKFYGGLWWIGDDESGAETGWKELEGALAALRRRIEYRNKASA